MLVIAFFICSALLKKEAERNGVDPEAIFNFVFTVFIFGVAGARVFYVAENTDYYFRYPLMIFALQQGGLSWFGGLILGVGAAVIYLKKKKSAVMKTFDLVIPFVALGQAIGRIGCLLNGCCFGKEATYGLYFKAQDSILIPTQIYSSLFLLGMFIVLRFMQSSPHHEGKIFYSYLFLYSIKRFVIEFWRADNPAIFAGFTLFQLMSTAIFCFAAVKLILICRNTQ